MANRYFMMNFNFGTPVVMNNPAFKKPRDIANDLILAYEQEHYKEKLHRNENGKPYLPMNAIHKVLQLASRYSTIKIPKGFRTWSGLVQNCVLITDHAILECSDSQVVPWTTNVGQEGKMGRRVMVETCRPQILLPISAGTKLLAVDDRLSKEFLEDITDLAGRVIGFMSANKLGYGRATITLQQIEKAALD
jgi:hypothetical protein